MARPIKDKVLAMAREYMQLNIEDAKRFNSLVKFGDELLTRVGTPPTQDPPKPKEKRVRAARKQEPAPEAQP